MQESIQSAKDAKDRKKISDMGYKKGGSVSSASKRADGCCIKGKTRGKMV
jgi:general stress protein YciG